MSEHHRLLDLVDKAAEGHSVFSPSSAAMWMGCPASLVANLRIRGDDAGYDAAYGTVAHGVAETWLREGRKPKKLLNTTETVRNGSTDFEIIIDREMMDFVGEYVSWCNAAGADIFIEQKVYFSHLTPLSGQGGTADHAACWPGKLRITDLKMGKGVQVFAKDNPQAQLYALGFFYEWNWLYDFEEIEIRICQPRLNHFDVWTISREELLVFAGQVRRAAYDAWREDAPRRPSQKACQWCKVKKTCPAFLGLVDSLIDDAFDDVEMAPQEAAERLADLDVEGYSPKLPKKYPQMNTGHLLAISEAKDAIISWLNAVDAELYARAMNGVDVPGKKLVDGRSSRAWTDEKQARGVLMSLGFEKAEMETVELKSPAQMEKAIKDRGLPKEVRDKLDSQMAKVVKWSTGTPVLVDKSDNRMERRVDDYFNE